MSKPSPLVDQRHRLRRLYRWSLIGCGGTLAVLIVMIALLFAPLALAAIEYYTFGSSTIENWFRTMGVHDQLGRLYEPIVSRLRQILP